MDQVVTDSASTEDLLNVVYDVSVDPSSFQTLSAAFEQWVWPNVQDAAMRIKGMGENSQKAHIKAVRYLAEFLGRSPDTATPEDLRAYQLHLVNTNVTPSTCDL